MRTLKLAIAAVILACSFQVANAQVRVGVRVGTPPPHREVVVVKHPVRREVVVRRAPVRTVVYRHGYRKPVYHHTYHRHHRVIRRY